MIDWLGDDLINFEPITHSYTNARTREKYVGITTFISQFEPPFDTEYWSARGAVKELYGARSYKYNGFRNYIKGKGKEVVYKYIENSPDKYKLLAEQRKLKEAWKDKNEIAKLKGHLYHAKQEDKINHNKYRVIENAIVHPMADTSGIPRSGGDKINLHSKLPDGGYSELLVKNHTLKLSGQVDYSFIETINGTRYVDIDDYKTNEKLTFENIYDTYFLEPIQFLDHHKFNIYRLQILLYAELFKSYGYVPRNLTLTYHPNTEIPPKVYRIYPFPDPDPIKLMLKTRSSYLKSL